MTDKNLSTSEKANKDDPCPLCGALNLQIFYHAKNVPTSCNLLWKTKKEAISCAKGEIKLAFCPSCTFISNIAIEPQKNQYGDLYDNSLFYSEVFQNFQRKLASSLIQRYILHNKTIIEVGCGKADFLSIFRKIGSNDGSKIHPKIFDDANPEKLRHLKADFIISYHELEHENNPQLFLNNLRASLAGNSETRLFFAVPNALKAFEEGDYKDIIYEHVSYFTTPALSMLFSRCGYAISELRESQNSVFDSLYIESSPNKAKQASIPKHLAKKIQTLIVTFSNKCAKNMYMQKKECARLLHQGKKIVVWGAGARGVTFLNILKDERIEYVVDINPRKQGMFVPGTGQAIVQPKFLQNYKPQIILLANPAYRKEVKHIIERLEVNAKLVSL